MGIGHVCVCMGGNGCSLKGNCRALCSHTIMFLFQESSLVRLVPSSQGRVMQCMYVGSRLWNSLEGIVVYEHTSHAYMSETCPIYVCW